VVAVMTQKVEKGYKPLAMVKEEITPAVRDEVKSKIMSEKLSKLTGTLEEIAQAYGPDAAVRSSSDIHLTSSSLPSIGVDPEVIGLIFSLESGKRTAPYAGESGVVIIEMQNKTIAPSIANYIQYKGQLEQSLSTQTSYNIAEAIKENAGIEDERYKFY
jgi:peptidyl-prolyl cis-trans isomerase D